MLERLVGSDRHRFVSVVHALSERYVTVRYRGSALGIVWSILNPVVMTALYAAIFGRAFEPYYGGSIVGYAAAVFVGLTTIQFFSAAAGQALQSVVGSSMLITRVKLPVVAIPVATVLAAAVQLAVGVLPILLILALAIGHNPIFALFVIVPLVGLVCLTLGFGLALSAANVFFRDVPYLYDMFVFMMFVATPVFYPLGIIDARIRPFVAWNPLSMIVEQLRAIVVLGRAPSPVALAAIVLISGAILAGGFLFFRKASDSFMEHL